MLDANTGGEQFCSYVRIKGITVAIFLHGYGSGLTGLFEKRFSKVSQANVHNKNYHKKKKLKKKKIQSWHIFIKQMNNQSTLEEYRILAGQFAHPTLLDMQRQGTG